MTREEAINIGLELQRIVNSESFKACISIMRQEYQEKVFGSLPTEREVREVAYYEAKALDNLIATMNSFIAVAEHEALVSLVYGDEEEEI